MTEGIGQQLHMHIITDLEARKIAAGWAEGGDQLQQLASTGTISNGTALLITDLMDNAAVEFLDWNDLYDLRAYCYYHGIRGPQEGWSNLNW